MNGQMGLVSVLIPVFNAAKYIGEALQSVYLQNWEPMEIIVVDDGSTDGSGEIAATFPGVKVFRQANGGLSRARNSCMERAQGEWIAFLDADDRWLPRKLELQMAAFGSGDECDLVFSRVRQFVSPELSDAEKATIRIIEEVIPGYVAGALLARRSVYERIGPFREDIRLAEALDWLSRARALGLREKMLDEILLERRLHTSNTGLRERDSRRDYLATIKAAMDRRRGGS